MTERFSLEDLKVHGDDIFTLQESLLSHVERLDLELEAAKSKVDSLNIDLEAAKANAESLRIDHEKVIQEKDEALREKEALLKQFLTQSNASNHISKRVLLAVLGSKDSLKSLL